MIKEMNMRWERHVAHKTGANKWTNLYGKPGDLGT